MATVHEGAEGDQKRNKKRALVVIAGLVAASGVGSLAFAYWTGGGSGGGGASTDSGSAPVSFVQTNTPAALTPGDTVTVSGTVDNTNNGGVQLSSVTPSVSFPSSATLQSDSTKPACTTGDFTVSAATLSTMLIPGNSSSVTWSVTLTMKNTSANQDNCKNQTPNVDITAS